MLKQRFKNWLGLEESKEKFIAGATIDYSGTAVEYNELEAMKTYSSNVWVGACVLIRANTFADTVFYLEDRQGKRIDNHPLLDLLANPSDSLTGYDLLRFTSMYNDLAGNAYWRYGIVGGRPENIEILLPNEMSLVKSETDGVIGYKYNLNGKMIPLELEEVTHFKSPNPLDPLKGVSPIFSASYQVDTDKHSNQWNYNFFKNGATTGTILKTERMLKRELKEKLVNKFNSKYKGSDNAHKTIVLDGGMSLDNMDSSHKDMQFTELQRVNRDKILGAYQVPKILLAQFEGGSLAEAETASDIFAGNVIDPVLRQFCSTINLDLVPLYGDRGLKLNFESKVKGDRQFEENKKNSATNIWMTINERREIEGYEPIEGGDVLYHAMNQVEVGSEPEIVEQPQEPVEEDVESQEEEEKRMKMIEKKAEPITKDIKEKFRQKYLLNYETFEKNFKKRLVTAFNNQQKETLEKLQKSKNYKYTKSLTDDIFDYEENKQYFIKLFTPTEMSIFLESGNEQSQIFRLGVDLTADTVGVQREVDKMVTKFSQEVTMTTKKQLRKELNEGVANGEGIPKLSARIKTVFKEAKTSRTNMIARTEITKATNAGALKSYEESDVVDGKEWLSTAGAREAHAVSQTRKLKQPFLIGGEQLEYPGDPSGSPENVINCRCTVIPIIN